MSATPATTNGTAASPLPHRNVVPSEVGWQFVPQYYTFMNKQPDRLHCFYTKQSTYTHGTEGDDVTPCHGQAEIHAKISSLNLNDCKVFIHSVDAQASLGGGIVIQVIGEMSNKEEPWRKFVQTFFLAEQPNGYFVLNDVFRFLKEEAVEDESSVADSQDPVTMTTSSETQSGPVVMQEEEIEEEVAVAAEPEPEVTAPEVPFSVTSKSPVPEPAPVEPASEAAPTPPAAVSGDWIESTLPPAEPAPPVEPKPATPPPVVEPAPVPTPAVPVHPANGAAAKPADKPAPPPVQAPAPSPPAKPLPKTWANLAAANSNKWGATAASTVATSAAPPPTAATPPGAKTPQRPSSGQAPQNRSPAYQTASTIQTPAVFIKGVVDPLSNDLLKSFLASEFGPLKEIEVVRSKACAFVEFVNLADARRAIIASLPIPQGGHGGVFYRYEDESTPPTRISIETRKERGDRPVSSGPPRGTGRGGFDGGRGGANVDGRGSFRGRGRGRGGAK
ncbi:hypothetical protein DL96DRAFT_1462516 [Flagelloscypha sp. PMI_526]|nr:hypothetical protein DL96DRAFT_1462516 [Flagelloscypha sp. PMI_526]